MAAELNADGVVSKRYIRGLQLICDSSDRYYMHNAHGDVVESFSGVFRSVHNYTAYGTQGYCENDDMDTFGYCGQQYDWETGNYYMRARYYNPDTGRFISEDPVKDGNNWYSYCAGNPVMFWDIMGLKPIIFVYVTDDENEDFQRKIEENTVSRYGSRGEEVEVITFGTNSEFIEKWDKTIMTSNDDIIIHTHGGATGIFAKNSDVVDDGINISNLTKKEVNSITLLSCNTGFLDEENNAAKQFYDRMDVNFVVAPDGTLYNNMNVDEKDYNKVDVYSGNSYEKSFKENKYREPEGFILYYKNSDSSEYSYIGIGKGPYYPDQVVRKANSEYNKVR